MDSAFAVPFILGGTQSQIGGVVCGFVFFRIYGADSGSPVLKCGTVVLKRWNIHAPYLYNPISYLLRHTIELQPKGLIVCELRKDNSFLKSRRFHKNGGDQETSLCFGCLIVASQNLGEEQKAHQVQGLLIPTKMCLNHLLLMEPSGIEPPLVPCESTVLPLNHGPFEFCDVGDESAPQERV